MPLLVCSLYMHQAETGGQLIDAADGYELVRFPYGAAENADPCGMHQPEQPDGTVAEFPDDRSGLIWPAADGWATVEANLHWESGSYTQLRDRFVRDPLGLTAAGYDSTGTDHRPPSPGMQCFTKSHVMYVRQGQPIALMAAQDDAEPRRLVHAQFKVAIHT